MMRFSSSPIPDSNSNLVTINVVQQIMTPSLWLVIVAASMVVALYVNPVTSVCCKWAFSDDCEDGELGTPCCGRGEKGCNFFCCNCDGGCRTQNKTRKTNSKRQATSTDLYNRYRSLDINGDGDVDEAEATHYARQIRQAEGFEFAAYDKDGDGVLSPEEIDDEPGV
ncbi:unnamed protein product [Allacma fusca]|uniref:EF-hand domain-containing protein n=1 Tax=Allacma fusca TaxID=39272 RepID=A0A8J2P2J5_9HEXA|nr:unnamed protein product [Allacma fusca]